MNQAMLSELLCLLPSHFALGLLHILDVKEQILRALLSKGISISDPIIGKIYKFFDAAFNYTSFYKDDSICQSEDTHGMGCEIDFRRGNFGIYVSVPPRHALFGKHHTAINMGASYSGTSSRSGWWTFGWNYGHTMTIDNLCQLIDAGDFEAIDRLEVCTQQSLVADIQLRFNQLKEAHLRITRSPYPAKPGSSQNNQRHRERRRERVKAAGPFQRAYWS
jgi:hypothetical protein